MTLLSLSVSQLNRYVQRALAGDPLLRDLEVTGEIANIRVYGGGTLFFTLRDAEATLPCVMFADDTERLATMPFDGMYVSARGSVGLYPKGGQYRLTVRSLRVSGIGVLYERLQALKRRLSEEGLFDEKNKIPIPRVVNTLGVVSSSSGAVIHDIINVATRRDPQARILLCPAKVQGSGAAEEVAKAINCLDNMPSVTTIVVARGGGSIEDLWAFNEEIAVRAVAACRKPIISAVGHETDVTLCDLAADLRAPTPSAAAECAIPIRLELMDELRDLLRKLQEGLAGCLSEQETHLAFAETRLLAVHPAKRIRRAEERLLDAEYLLKKSSTDFLNRREEQLEHLLRELNLAGPEAVLRRGFALVLRSSGNAAISAQELLDGERVILRFGDGIVPAVIQRDITKGKALE